MHQQEQISLSLFQFTNVLGSSPQMSIHVPRSLQEPPLSASPHRQLSSKILPSLFSTPQDQVPCAFPHWSFSSALMLLSRAFSRVRNGSSKMSYGMLDLSGNSFHGAKYKLHKKPFPFIHR